MTSPQPSKIHPELSAAKLAEARAALQANPSDPKNQRMVQYWERNLKIGLSDVEARNAAYRHTN